MPSDITFDKIYPDSRIKLPKQAEWQFTAYQNRIEEFKKEPIGFNKIVFLGNSIIEGGKDWNEKFGSSNIVNRGISGDMTSTMIERLKEIYHYKPLKVFLLIGINDVFDGVIPYKKNKTAKEVASNILKIADSIKYYSNGTEVFIHTLLPIDKEKFKSERGFYPKHNYPMEKQIIQINRNIIRKVKRSEYQIIDIFSLFVDENGKMTKGLSKDGLHLNEKGYELWVNHIKEYIIN
ncbi:MAG: hypothetical protein CMG60_06310 [Candidatus Marinimicrobia bacterium]|nr:hypothetical protein [Candidatus Neomarinimicrobiota bacterium]|tara:strand:- start:2481 stop:3185 length:705 start_codon:yes stop_codon:yes gene_type:complete